MMDNLFDLLQLIEESRVEYSDFDDRFEHGMALITKEVETLTSAWCVMIQRSQEVVKAVDRRLDGVEEAVVAILDPLPAEDLLTTALVPDAQDFEPDLKDLLSVQSSNVLLRHRIESCNEGLIRRLSRLQASAGLGSRHLARFCPWSHRSTYEGAVLDVTDLMLRLSASYGLQLRLNGRLREALCSLSENIGGVLTALELAAVENGDVASVLKRRHTMACILDCRAYNAQVLDVLAESFNKLISPV